jgi:hypothetical protein
MAKSKRKPDCPNWPQCPCVMQGFVNYAELNDCGREPKKKQKRVRRCERRDIVDVIFEYYGSKQ